MDKNEKMQKDQKNYSKKFSKKFHLFRFRSNIFVREVHADTTDLVRKSFKSEPSTQFLSPFERFRRFEPFKRFGTFWNIL